MHAPFDCGWLTINGEVVGFYFEPYNGCFNTYITNITHYIFQTRHLTVARLLPWCAYKKFLNSTPCVVDTHLEYDLVCTFLSVLLRSKLNCAEPGVIHPYREPLSAYRET